MNGKVARAAQRGVLLSVVFALGLAIFFRDVTEHNAALEAVRVSQMRAENEIGRASCRERVCT